MKRIFLSLVLLCNYALFAQQNFWTKTQEASISKNLFANRQRPSSFQLFRLDAIGLQNAMRAAPLDIITPAVQSTFVVSFPMSDGTNETFRVSNAPVMEEGLATKFPGIHSYSGVSVADPSVSIRFSISPLGFRGMILSAKKSTVYIDPLEDNIYMVLSRNVMARSQDKFDCLTTSIASADALEEDNPLLENANDGILRTYRIAMVCSGEFSQFWLDGSEANDTERKAKVTAALNDALTRTNGIYERDFGVRLLLIASNASIIYLDAATDPIGTSSGSWNSQTQTTCTNVIGSANYDIGHLVHRGPTNNGNAGCIGCVCTAGTKGSGWTSYIDLSSDFFVVDYLTHEIGHQFGGNHTFTHNNEGTTAQVEPGSGSTIMGYAGITGATDVQPHSDDYFHAATILQITNYIKTGGGAGCAQQISTGNSTPTANAGADYTIPRSTPFMLSGIGSDANTGDVLTYTWEQMNQRATGFSTIPSATATAGPQFRSQPPAIDATRIFPELNSILGGTNSNTWEVLPSVARTLNFRFTVRDNRPGGGSNQSDNMVLTVSGTTGPFAVTAPNTAVSWAANSTQTITWSVNGTSGAPINCANVRILLSVDGGGSYVTLAASTPNDGSETITIPNSVSSFCRIKIEAIGNIFFDISNVNFSITAPPACGNVTGQIASSITISSATLNWSAVSGATNYDVDYKVASSSTWFTGVVGSTGTSFTLSGLTDATLYDWRVRANCSAGTGNFSQAQFTTVANCNAPANLSSSSITGSSALVSWAAVAGANNYTVEYKTNAATSWTVAANATTALSQSITGLAASTLYDWRVRANCAVGNSSYSAAQFTTQAANSCPSTYDISTNGTRTGAAFIPFNTDIKGLISPSGDNDYYAFTITTGGTISVALTTLPADYDLRLYRNATQVGLSQNGGTNSETINYTATPATYYARVYGFNNANNATNCYTLKVTLGTASREEQLITASKISVFPNPASNVLTVHIAQLKGTADISLLDMYGKTVAQQRTAKINTEINIENLPAGIYLVRVINEGKESTTKVIKQ
jgi:Metallo-peptidase family M12B Reprolysin-like/Secretion system C-terminal sorting domain/Bacterial pre-peptidase C-terminal domain/Fibronectin type III domain